MAGQPQSVSLFHESTRVSCTKLVASSLAAALAVGVAEVLVRFVRSTDPVSAAQLWLAASANVAILGVFACVVAVAGWLVARFIARVFPTLVTCTHIHARNFHIAVVLSVLILLTEFMGFHHRPISAMTAGVTFAGIFALVALLRRIGGIGTLSGRLLASCVACWLLCTGAAVWTATQTHQRLQRWVSSVPPDASARAFARPNLILIVVDTLRADRVGAYGESKLTPNLDRFAGSATVYRRAISTAPWTLPAHASLFTGLYPESHGVNWGHYRLGSEFPVLASLLKDAGYDTLAISNNWLLSKDNGFARGFDDFLEPPNDPWLKNWRLALQCAPARSILRQIGPGVDAGHDAGSSLTNWLVDRRLARHRSAENPFFLFINYFEPHDPYRPPARYLNMMLSDLERQDYGRLTQREEDLAAHACGLAGVYTDDQIPLLSRLYDAEVAYQDDMLGALFAIFQRHGIMDDTWIVITSDHGELFGEWGMVYHTAGSHHHLLHVPLIVRPPGGAQAAEVNAYVQPVDVFVTLLEAAGAAVPASVQRAFALPLRTHRGRRNISVAQSHGASIAALSMSQRRSMQAKLDHWLTWVDSVYVDQHVLELSGGRPRALYDLSTDPNMEVNLVHSHPEVVQTTMDGYERWKRTVTLGDSL